MTTSCYNKKKYHVKGENTAGGCRIEILGRRMSKLGRGALSGHRTVNRAEAG